MYKKSNNLNPVDDVLSIESWKKPKRQFVEREKNAFKIDDYKIVLLFFIGFTLLSKWHYEMYFLKKNIWISQLKMWISDFNLEFGVNRNCIMFLMVEDFLLKFDISFCWDMQMHLNSLFLFTLSLFSFW